MAPSRPPEQDAARLVEELTDYCATLQHSQQTLRRVPAAEIEKAVRKHLRARGPVCEQIERITRSLAGRASEIDRLPPLERDEILSDLQQCRCVLQAVGARYGEMAAAVEDILGAVRRRLADLRRGGQMLTMYRRGARLAR